MNLPDSPSGRSTNERREGTAGRERIYRFVLSVLAIACLSLGIAILVAPDAMLGHFDSEIDADIGWREMLLSMAYLVIVMILARSAQDDLRHRRRRLAVLVGVTAITSMASGLTYWLADDATTAYLTSFLVNGFIAFSMLWIWSGVSKLESPFLGRTAIVTGAASGLGRALAEELGREGAWVRLADRDIEQCEAVAEGIRKNGGQAEAVYIDVTDADAVRLLVESCVEQHGSLDYMFNNAGTALTGQLRDCEIKDLERILRINLDGVVYGTHAAYRAMLPRGSGHIINTSSLSGLTYQPGGAIYCASKYGVAGFSQSVRAEGAALGIKVSMICPGALKTAFWDNMQVVKMSKADAQRPRAIGQTPQAAARVILRGVEQNKAIIFTPTWYSWLMRLSRPLPESDEWFAKRMAAAMHRNRLEE